VAYSMKAMSVDQAFYIKFFPTKPKRDLVPSIILPSETGDFLRELRYKIDRALVEKARSAPPQSQTERRATSDQDTWRV
jgi:hypothetical protein